MSKVSLGRVPVPLTQIENHFIDQIGFLEASCKAFDTGKTSEYKRIALAIRVLAYDRGQSRSLLRQLSMKDVPFISYAGKINLKNLIPSHPLAMIRIDGKGSRYIAKLDGGDDPPKFLQFDTWWSECVFRTPEGISLTRGDFVSIVANQDGGAHVDPDLDERYSKLVNDNLAGWMVSTADGESPMLHIEKTYLRHIGFELLCSISDAWEKRMGNRLCECGSGRKYRYCHGKKGKS